MNHRTFDGQRCFRAEITAIPTPLERLAEKNGSKAL
jgi:hypothetical protein